MADFVSAVSAATTVSGSSLTIPSVNGGGGNTIVITVTWVQEAGQTISSVTYNGSATGITLAIDGVANQRAGAIYYLVNAAGTADVVITMSADSARIFGTAVVISNADTASPIRDSDEATGTGTTATCPTLTTAADDVIVDVLSLRLGVTETVNAGANQTERGAQNSNSASIKHRCSTQDGADGGDMTWTWTTGTDWYIAAVSVRGGVTAVPAGILIAPPGFV